MTREEIGENVGKIVTINGMRDLGMEAEMQKYIRTGIKLRILRLTKGGLAYLEEVDSETSIRVTVPPLNVDL